MIYNKNISIEDIDDEHKGGNCYEDSFLFVERNNNFKLVHAIVTGRGALEGVKFVHAFVEFGNIVWDCNIGFFKKDEYYKIGQIEVTRKYTIKEAVSLLDEYYEPWDEVFKQEGLL